MKVKEIEIKEKLLTTIEIKIPTVEGDRFPIKHERNDSIFNTSGLWILSDGEVLLDRGEVMHIMYSFIVKEGEIFASDVGSYKTYNFTRDKHKYKSSCYPIYRVSFNDAKEMKQFINKEVEFTKNTPFLSDLEFTIKLLKKLS